MKKWILQSLKKYSPTPKTKATSNYLMKFLKRKNSARSSPVRKRKLWVKNSVRCKRKKELRQE
jgi:hypothetical protein